MLEAKYFNEVFENFTVYMVLALLVWFCVWGAGCISLIHE